MDASTTSLWAPVIKPLADPALRLICFPYAGASAWMYRPWREGMPNGVEVRAVQLPGRGSRLREERFTRLDALADAVALALRPLLDRPFAFFGHSLGSLVAFETARRLRASGLSPVHLFVSAEDAPHMPDRNPPLHHLGEAEFLRELRELNGMPQVIMDSPELLELMLPVVRSDFTVLETYAFETAAPLSCPITAFGGSHDPRTGPEALRAWAAHTECAFAFESVPGDHFFVESARGHILPVVASALTRAMACPVAKT